MTVGLLSFFVAPPTIPTVPFIQEVTVAAPDIIRVEVLDPITQRGVIQYSNVPFAGTDRVFATYTNPLTGLPDLAAPLGPVGNMFALRFQDVIPTNYFNRTAGMVAANWGITGKTVTNVYRETKPYNEADQAPLPGQSFQSMRHYLWLKLNSSLSSGTTYTITPPAGTGLASFAFAFNDATTRCCAINSNQAGHRANDDYKAANLSAWIPGFGTEGRVDYAGTYGLSTFNVIDKTGTAVATGLTFSERASPTLPESGDLGQTIAVAIGAASWAGGQATFTLANGAKAGDGILAAGFTPAGYNGSYTVVSANATSITVALAVNPGSNNTVAGSLQFNRYYTSTTQPYANILGVTFANPGVFTTDISVPNGTVVRLQGLGKGIAVTGAVWSSANGGQIVYTVVNGSSGGAYSVGNYATFSGFTPSGYNGTFQVFAETGTTITVLAPNPGAFSVLGTMSNPAGNLIAPAGANSASYFVVANAAGTGPFTCTLKQLNLIGGAVGADVSTVGLGPWGQGSFLNPTVCAALGADDNGGYGFDSLMQPCYLANRSNTHVFPLDFSSLTATNLPSSGSPYRVQIPGVGVSDPLTINDNVWYNIAWNWMKGLYHQTSGNAIDGRFGFTRNAALIDGLNGTQLFQSTLPMSFTAEAESPSSPSLFQGMMALAPFITSTRGPAGLGGAYHDSGDWTSVLQPHASHIFRLLHYGYEYIGGTTASITAGRSTTFNFPLSSTTWGSLYTPIDGMPDVIHAAIYFLEYYRLTQDINGAVASGTGFGDINGGDGGGDPIRPSSANSLAFALGAPDHMANYSYSCTAAKLAIQLYNAGFTTLGNMWRDSAISAFNWAEGVYNGLQTDPQFYYGSTAYFGTALNIPTNSALANLNPAYSAAPPALLTSTSGFTTTNGANALGAITAGSGYVPGTYTNVPLTGGTGTGAKAVIVVSAGGAVTTCKIMDPGNNYVVADVLSASNVNLGGSGSGFSIPVSSVTQATSLNTSVGTIGIISAFSTITAGTLYTPGTYTNVPLTGGSGSGATATVVVGAGGGVTSVTKTLGGKNYVHLDSLSANASDIGGTGSGFSVLVNTLSSLGSFANFSLQYRCVAACTLFRLEGIIGGSQTQWQNAALSMGVNTFAFNQATFAGILEVANSANNTTLMAFFATAGLPTTIYTQGAAVCTIAENTSNAYYTYNAALATRPINNKGVPDSYINKVGSGGTSDATAIRIRKMWQAQHGFALGMNQEGICFPCGIGVRNTLGVLHRDWQGCQHLVSGFQPPPAGVTPFGFNGLLFPVGFTNFTLDSPSNFDVILPTGIWEATHGTKKIIYPVHFALPMHEGTIENSSCVGIMEYAGLSQSIDSFIVALILWCWDGNSAK